MIQTDHLISAGRQDLVIVNKKKKNCQNVDFAVPADLRVKLKESEKKNKYLDLAGEFKKNIEHERNWGTKCNWCTWYNHQMKYNGTGGLGNKRMCGKHLKDRGDLLSFKLHWKTIGQIWCEKKTL